MSSLKNIISDNNKENKILKEKWINRIVIYMDPNKRKQQEINSNFLAAGR